GPRTPRGRRALPVRDQLMMREDPSVRDTSADDAQGRQEAQEAAIVPLGTPEAEAADAQRLRSDRGELPASGDITPTGDDRRRRRRGRRGGRRARGRNGGSDGDRNGSSPHDASADDGE
ncbi:MAG TPA: hypothetical protein VGE02_13190, partial [Gemmatimonadales bacterium]